MFKPARHGEVGGVSLQRSQQQKPLRSHGRLNLCAEMSHKIVNLRVRDVRFPTSLEQHGSDAMVRSLCSSFSTRVHVRIHRHSHKNETFPPLSCPRCSTPTRTTRPPMWSSTRTAASKVSASRSRWEKAPRSVRSTRGGLKDPLWRSHHNKLAVAFKCTQWARNFWFLNSVNFIKRFSVGEKNLSYIE